jgi:hypothetical protein
MIAALIIVSYVILIGHVFQPDVYYFQDRTTYHDFFSKDNFVLKLLAVMIVVILIAWFIFTLEGMIMIISIAAGITISLAGYLAFHDEWLIVVALASVPLLLLVLAWSYKINFLIRSPQKHSQFTINYLCLSFIVLAAISIGASLLGVDALRYDPFYQIFVLFSTLSPVILFLIMMSVPIMILLDYSEISSRIKNHLVAMSALTLNIKTNFLFLTMFVAISIILIVIPQLLSGEQRNVGVDTDTYLEWISIIDQSPNPVLYLRQLFVEISDGDRALSLLFIHLLTKLAVNIDQLTIIEVGIPVVIIPILVVVTFLLSREVTHDDQTSLIASFFAAIGFQVLVGLYAGFFANWIALIPAYVSILFLLKFLKSSKNANLGIFSISLFILLFTHVYTWTIITIFVLLFLAIGAIKHTYQRRLILFSILVVLAIIGTDVLRSHVFGFEPGMEKDLSVAKSTDAGLSQVDIRWDNLVRTVQVHTGGFYGNFIFLALVLSGILFARMNFPVWLFVGTFVSIGILPLFFGNVIIMSRVLYDIPFQIPAGLALTGVLRTENGILRVTAILLAILAISVHLVSNLR